MPAEWLTITGLLNIAKTAGHATIAVGVESVEIDGNSPVAAGIDFGAVEDWIHVLIHDLRSINTVGIHEIMSGISVIVTLSISITQWKL